MKYYYKACAVLIFPLLLLACSEHENTIDLQYEKDMQKWERYFDTLGVEISMDKSLVMILNPTFCGDCHMELKNWNALSESAFFQNIHVILIDRYASNIDNYIKNEGFGFNYYYDTSAFALRDSLVHALPRRIYFKGGVIAEVGRIGDRNSFLKLKEEFFSTL